jgi:hypothetical protein
MVKKNSKIKISLDNYAYLVALSVFAEEVYFSDPSRGNGSFDEYLNAKKSLYETIEFGLGLDKCNSCGLVGGQVKELSGKAYCHPNQRHGRNALSCYENVWIGGRSNA